MLLQNIFLTYININRIKFNVNIFFYILTLNYNNKSTQIEYMKEQFLCFMLNIIYNNFYFI